MHLLYSLYVCVHIDSTVDVLVIRYIRMLLLACNCSSEYNASVHTFLCDSVSQIYWKHIMLVNVFLRSNRDFGLRSFQLLLGKSVWIQEHLKSQSGEESSSSGRFNPVGHLQQSA